MTRRTVAADRFLVFVVGALLVAGGVLAVLWSRGDLGGARSLQVVSPVSNVASPWWPWASGAAGLVLVLLGLWWLSAHRRTPRVRNVRLADPGPDEGALSADAASVGSAAAATLAQHPLVLKVGSRSSIEKGAPTITLSAHIAPRRTLRAASMAADEVAATAAAMLGDSVAIRTRIRVDARSRATPVE